MSTGARGPGAEPELSVVVVTYRRPPVLAGCLARLEALRDELREGLWEDSEPSAPLRVGRRLAELASRDPMTRRPTPQLSSAPR